MLESYYHCGLGPIWVTKRIGDVAYRVQLPSTFKIHDVCHVSFLRPHTTDGKI